MITQVSSNICIIRYKLKLYTILILLQIVQFFDLSKNKEQRTMKMSLWRYNRNVGKIVRNVYIVIGGNVPPPIIRDLISRRVGRDNVTVTSIWRTQRLQYGDKNRNLEQPTKKILSANEMNQVISYINNCFDILDKLMDRNAYLVIEPLVIKWEYPTESKNSNIKIIDEIPKVKIIDEIPKVKIIDEDEESNIEDQEKINVEIMENELPICTNNLPNPVNNLLNPVNNQLNPVNNLLNSVNNPQTCLLDDSAIIRMMNKTGQEKFASIIFGNLNLIKYMGLNKCELCNPIHPTPVHYINNMYVCHPCAMIVMRQYLLHGFDLKPVFGSNSI